MSTRWLVVALVMAATTCGVGFAVADCPQICEECSADPIFVQRDQRDPIGIAEARELRKTLALLRDTVGSISVEKASRNSDTLEEGE